MSRTESPRINEHSSLLGNGNGNGNSNGNSNGYDNGNGVENGHHKPVWSWSYWPRHMLHLTWVTLSRDYVNLLLVFVPLGIVAGALNWDATAIFTLNFFAIIPLASLLSFATEELAATLGQALGGLMNATFGNAVELIVRLSSVVLLGQGGADVYRSVSLR